MDVRCDSEACWRYAERGPWESHSSHVSRKQATLESDVAARVIAFIEGDVFKGSRQMPLEDLLAAMPDDYRIPGLPAVHSGAYWCIFFKSPCGEMPRCTSRQRV